MKGVNQMRANGWIQQIVDYIKDILSQFDLRQQSEREIYMASSDNRFLE